MNTIDLRSITIGFDPRLHGMQIDLSSHVADDGATTARYDVPTESGYQERHAAGDLAAVLSALEAAGYDLVVAHTPNGRQIVFARGRFGVQPHNDNYLIRVGSLREAQDAYLHPERHE